MPRWIEFYFDFVSPYSYLATTQFAALRAEAEIVHKPFRLLELMKLVGNRPTTVECQNKSNYARVDIARWAARYGVPYHRNPHMRGFDQDGLRCAALVAIEQGRGDAAVLAIFRALWAGEANLAEPATLAALLGEAGLDGPRVIELSATPEYGRKLESATREAAERGVFGSPSFFVGDQMFFGNDRLDFVAATLQRAA
jgi:2-hydroxychromene-2-carboxylate isomerase